MEKFYSFAQHSTGKAAPENGAAVRPFDQIVSHTGPYFTTARL